MEKNYFGKSHNVEIRPADAATYIALNIFRTGTKDFFSISP